MGTNYYQRINICDCCSRFDEIHIGKSSAGWQFHFQGYIDRDSFPKIASFEDWKRELQVGKIVDEYGREYTLPEFIEIVEAKQKVLTNINHYEYCQSAEGYTRNNRDWIDKEGYSFTKSEFS